MFLIEHWLEAWAALGVPETPELKLLHARLAQHYRESHRHYHTLQHLSECFDHLSELAPHLAHKPEVELAIWFHDAVYETHRTDNETLSAIWAADSARSLGVAGPSVARIAHLVIATCHNAEPEGADAAPKMPTWASWAPPSSASSSMSGKSRRSTNVFSSKPDTFA